MISLETLRDYMKSQLAEDQSIKSIRVSGGSIEDALKAASIELESPVKKLEYEIVEEGSKGTLGMGKREWVILAYVAAKQVELSDTDQIDLDALGLGFDDAETISDRAGEVFVRLSHDGVFLKVTGPTGSGGDVSEGMALNKLAERGVDNFEAQVVKKVVKHADGEYIKVGEFDYNPANQSVLIVDTADLDMKAFITVTQPGPGGPDMGFDEIVGLLKNNGIVFGIKEQVIREFVDYPRYNEKILVAEGSRPQNGQDGKIIYNFTTDHSEITLKEKNGRVDFKELNLVENVEAGQLLAKKVPAEEGQPGSSVKGKVTPAKAGKDVDIDIGKNVKLSDDGATVLSTINGQVLLVAGKINVEPVYTVDGDVNFRTGNILFLGTVIVKGNVEDGFTVKAAGNIEIMGSVGKCVLDAEGEIIVHQGVMGKNAGQVRAGINVVAKFIEHTHVAAEENVIVSDGIIHSTVDANKRILCSGKRAAIVGGRLRATEEINAKTFGSVAGTETLLEVGFDPKRKERLSQLNQKKEEIGKQLEELERNIKTLENLKRVQKKLSEDKLKSLEEFGEIRSQAHEELEEVNKEAAEINNFLSSLEVKGKISASDRVYPGVKIFIKNENLIVRNEFKKVTFFLEGKEVRMTKYEPIEAD